MTDDDCEAVNYSRAIIKLARLARRSRSAAVRLAALMDADGCCPHPTANDPGSTLLKFHVRLRHMRHHPPPF